MFCFQLEFLLFPLIFSSNSSSLRKPINEKNIAHKVRISLSVDGAIGSSMNLTSADFEALIRSLLPPILVNNYH